MDPAFRAFLHDLRLSPRSVLRRAGLPDDLFGRGPINLTPDEYYRLWAALEDEGGERVLALDVGNAISVEAFSPPIMAALCSPNLSVAAQRIADFKPLIGPVGIDVTVTDDGLQVEYRWPRTDSPPEVLAVSELVFWAALARIGTREHIRPLQVVTPHPIRGHAELEKFFGARIRHGDHHAIVFSRIDAERVFLTENETMWRFFAPELRRRLSDLDARATAADRVRAALHEMLPAGDSSVGTVSDRLATSPRTLQRQLRDEGTTFQQVLSTTREDLARHYLDQGSLRTAEIAYLLGYDDTNSFYRAFRTWTGTTPDALRSEVAASG
ncbi:AraC-type DNA-binding protein [Rhodococcoides kyotonense]|uniref:AraC-type DNA-binding protein n=1 Tax=Rhodococcoides kyotonense TaxID=398843 RepID=A0A239CJ37_9NOCA|nr:AraC-type DNA-binding protein [Rhodococcus kyotonensis]